MRGLCLAHPLGEYRSHEQAHAKKAVIPLYELARTTPFPKLEFGKASYSKYTENIENITTVFYKIDFREQQ